MKLIKNNKLLTELLLEHISLMNGTEHTERQKVHIYWKMMGICHCIDALGIKLSNEITVSMNLIHRGLSVNGEEGYDVSESKN